METFEIEVGEEQVADEPRDDGSERAPAVVGANPVRQKERLNFAHGTQSTAGHFGYTPGKHEDPELDRQFGLRDLPRGAFLGLVEISGTTQLNAERWERLRKYHLSGENFQVGVFAWTLANPRRLIEPILAPGSLRLFQVDKQLSQRLTSMLE